MDILDKMSGFFDFSWYEPFSWVNLVLPLSIALLVFGLIVWQKRKYTWAVLAGLFSIFVLLVLVVAWLYQESLVCLKPGASLLCGEWAGLWIIGYAFQALAAGLLFLIFAIGISLLHRYVFSTNLRLTANKSIVVAILLVLTVFSFLGSFIGHQILWMWYFPESPNVSEAPETFYIVLLSAAFSFLTGAITLTLLFTKSRYFRDFGRSNS